MDILQQLLQISAKLYRFLEIIPKEENREDFIEKINGLLDQRGEIIEQFKKEGFQFNTEDKLHITLLHLDEGIRERLNKVMDEIKLDMKKIQASKRNEKQYSNPYSSVRVMDGMYYDKKK